MQSNTLPVSPKKSAKTTGASEKNFLNPQDWPAISRAWEKSGMPQKQFCSTHGISYSAFVYHRVQLIKAKDKNNPIPTPLIPVQLVQPKPSVSTTAPNCCVIQWPNGVRLSVPSGADAAIVKTLLTSLAAL